MLLGNNTSSFEKRLFQLLVFLIPTQLALHLWPDWAFIFGIRVDYLSPAIYLTDILLLLILGLWFFKNRGRRYLTKKKTWVVSSLFMVVYTFLNIHLALRPEVALIRWVKFFAFGLFAFYISRNKRINYQDWFLKPLKLSLIVISLIGIGQFLFQQSLGGPFYFLGERAFTASTPGIALERIFGKDYLRSYSTFSHPNSLAGFLLVSLLLLYYKSNKLKRSDLLVIGLSLVALLLTFSKSAIAVLLILVLVRLIKFNGKVNKEKYKKGFLFLILFASLLLPIFSQQLLSVNDYREEIEKRFVLAKASGELFSERAVLGVGLNNFVVGLPTTSLTTKHVWDLQPAHNIFLLVLSEVGIVGLFLILFVFYKSFLENKNETYSVAFYAILLTGFTDHYWLTLQQNILLLTFLLGFVMRAKNKK